MVFWDFLNFFVEYIYSVIQKLSQVLREVQQNFNIFWQLKRPADIILPWMLKLDMT